MPKKLKDWAKTHMASPDQIPVLCVLQILFLEGKAMMTTLLLEY